MSKILFENNNFRSELINDGSTIITVLKDTKLFYGISLEGCKFITDKDGFIADELTESALIKIKDFCIKSTDDISEPTFKLELRNRMLNIFIGMVFAY